MIVVAVLAIALMAQLDANAPSPIKPFESVEECLVEAEKMNKTDERLRSKEAREAGAEYVCLHIRRISI